MIWNNNMEELEKINGYEIIDFLNKLYDNNDELSDISCEGPYTFEKQKLTKKEYKLTFSAYYNNWGTDQEISDNHIIIDKNGIRLLFQEPFDSDESSDVFEKILTEWLLTHDFANDNKEKYEALIKKSGKLLSNVKYGDSDVLNSIIKNLTKAKTLIK